MSAHDIEETHRTDDVKIANSVGFAIMTLKKSILNGLKKCGYKVPSPIQLKAVPLAILGYDLVVKAKSGTGKTLVFAIGALQMINVQNKNLQIIIIAPTREIAVQIKDVISSVGREFRGLRVEYFIGGTPVQDDKNKLKYCQIAVGAPGRLKHLIDEGVLNVKEINLLILDEADSLISDNHRDVVQYIYKKLEGKKQVIATSATYPIELNLFLSEYMKSPLHVTPETRVPCLIGIKQFYTKIPSHPNVLQQILLRNDEIYRLLSMVSFNQCLIFSNYQTRAESLCNNLMQKGWPSLYIGGCQPQKKRMAIMDSLKDFKCRVLCSSDLIARGIDASNVDLVINYEMPLETETYLHRMGRAGRYGSYGMCISITAGEEDVELLQRILGSIGENISISKLPTKDEKYDKSIWSSKFDDLEQIHALIESKENLIDVPEKLESVVKVGSIVATEKISEIENAGMNQLEEMDKKEVKSVVANKYVTQLSNLLLQNYNSGLDKNIVTAAQNVLEQNTNEEVSGEKILKDKNDSPIIISYLKKSNDPITTNNKNILDELLNNQDLVIHNKALLEGLIKGNGGNYDASVKKMVYEKLVSTKPIKNEITPETAFQYSRIDDAFLNDDWNDSSDDNYQPNIPDSEIKKKRVVHFSTSAKMQSEVKPISVVHSTNSVEEICVKTEEPDRNIKENIEFDTASHHECKTDNVKIKIERDSLINKPEVTIISDEVDHKNKIITNSNIDSHSDELTIEIRNPIEISSIKEDHTNKAFFSQKENLNNDQEQDLSSKSTHTSFDNDLEALRENKTWAKNVALYNVVKYLLDQKEEFNKKYVMNVSRLLEILKDEVDTTGKQHRINILEDVKKYLNLSGTNSSLITSKLLSAANNSCDRLAKCCCFEQMFSLAFDFVVDQSVDYWKCKLCTDSLKEEQQEINQVHSSTNEPIEDDSWQIDNLEETEGEITDIEIEEDGCYDCSVSTSVSEPVSANDGLYIYKKRKCNEQRNVPVEEEDVDHILHSDQTYESFLESYSSYLSKTALAFTNAEEFSKWYDEIWKKQLESAREQIERDIFAKEILKGRVPQKK